MDEDANKSEATKWLIRQVEAYGFTKTVLIVLAVVIVLWLISWVITWLILQRNALASVGKTKAETAAIQEELFQKLEKSRATVNSQTEFIGLKLRELLAMIKEGDAVKLAAGREELCRFYAVEFMPALCKYLEQIPRLLERGEAYNRLLEDVVPSLKSMVKFLETVNHDRLLAHLQNPSKYLLDPTAFNVLINRSKFLCPLLRFDTRSEINKTAKSAQVFFRK